MRVRFVVLLCVGVLLASFSSLLTGQAAGAPPASVSGTVQTLSSPARLLDTRIGLGGVKGAVVSGHSVSLQVAGRGGVPSTGVGAVMLNVTVTGAQGTGNVTVFADRSSKPATSNLNYVKGQTVPNLIFAPVGVDGKVAIAVSGGTTQLIADVSAYVVAPANGYTSTAAGTVQPVSTPARLLDTRIGLGATKVAVANGHSVSLQVAGRGGVPSTGVGAVVLNVTVTGAQGVGNVTVYADGSGKPATSNLNYAKGQTVPNLVLAPVGVDGKVALSVSGGTTDLIADVGAYELAGTPLISDAVVPVTPVRLLDTRIGLGATKVAVANGHSVSLQVAGRGGVPSTGVGAVVLNVTVTGAQGVGNVTVYADGSGKPATSNLNYAKGQTVPNLVLAPVGADGKVALSVSGGTTDLIADVSAYVRSAKAAWAPATTIDPTRGDPTGLSCPAVNFCAAVDASGQALFYNGQSWSTPTTVNNGDPLTDVSCSSSTACVAVDSQGQATVWNGTSWSSWVSVLGVSGSDGYVSCAPATFVCVAAAGHVVARFDGTSWSATTTLNTGAGSLTSASCASPTFCLVGGSAGTVNTYTHGVWSDSTTVFPNQLGPAVGVSCASDSSCLAIESNSASSFDGSEWTTPTQVTAADRALSAVSCPATGQCVAVDNIGLGYTFSAGTWASGDALVVHGPLSLACPQPGSCIALDSSGYVTSYANGSWAAAVAVDEPSGTLAAVSCTSTAFCLAVDTHGAALTYNGANWSAPTPIGRNIAPISLSCVGSGFCAMGSYDGRLGVYDNGTWSLSTVAVNGDEFIAVSCTSSQYCVALDSSGQATTWTGSSWSAPVDAIHFSPAGSNYVQSVSCPTEGTCYADNSSGGVWTLSANLWSGPVVATQTGTGAISCWSVGECRMSADGGYFASMHNGSWDAHLSSTQYPSGSPIASLDCVTATFCGAAGGYGIAFVSVFDGQIWQPVDEVSETVNVPVAISCPTTTLCIGVAGGQARLWSS